MSTTGNGSMPVHYERVVVPLDRTPEAEAALSHAVTLARSLGLPIHLLHVVDITPLAQVSLFGVNDVNFLTALGLVEAETEVAPKYLEDVGQRLVQQGFAPTFEVRRGLMVPDLIDAVKPSDLMVMVMHDRSGLTSWIAGDDTEAVIRRSPAPVLLVRPAAVSAKSSSTAKVAA